MNYNVISADSHIDVKYLPGDLFVSNAPAEWKDQAPRIVETREGKKWFSEGTDLSARLPNANMGFFERGFSKRIDRMFDAGFFDGRSHPTDPELRMKHQDMDGIDAEVIYGVLHLGNHIESRELLNLIYRTYNTWVADFCKANPDRLAGLACLPNEDPEAAAAELRRVAALGIRGAEFAVSTAAKPVWHKDWFPLWEAAAECNTPISFHTTGLPTREPDDAETKEYTAQYLGTWLTMFQLAGAESLASILFSGALDRFPDFKFVLGESGVAWIPFILGRVDEKYEDRYTYLNFSMPPSDYWRRQGYTTFQQESTVPDVIQLVGEDNVLWGSDYPHSDGVWPDSQDVIAKDLGRLDDRVLQKVIRDNTGKLYGFLN